MHDCRTTLKRGIFPRGAGKKQDERTFCSPVPGWCSRLIAGIHLGTFVLLLCTLLEPWLFPGRKHQRPLFRMPLTKAGHCLAGYHNLVRVGQGVFVCQVCALMCACPYCVSHIPAGMPFVNCSYHQDAYLELQDAVLPTTAITLNGRRV